MTIRKQKWGARLILLCLAGGLVYGIERLSFIRFKRAIRLWPLRTHYRLLEFYLVLLYGVIGVCLFLGVILFFIWLFETGFPALWKAAKYKT